MKEYTILSFFSVLVALGIDVALKTRLFKKKEFYLFLSIIYGFKFLVNGFLTGENIVVYHQPFYLGIRLGTIPVEDFLFGFSMIMLTLVFWESFKEKASIEKS
ncbi:MAG: lycopene cyclase domain-containing protein [Candidatus Omnitrophica bacterium]|nr:lycopene cyclase domain-containing protein [Candidatus Omnitrophota bacterium]